MMKSSGQEQEHFQEFDDVRVTGTIISETPPIKVEGLEAVVATVYSTDHRDYNYFKVWPKDSNDPQIGRDGIDHDGKLWFERDEATVEVKNDD